MDVKGVCIVAGCGILTAAGVGLLGFGLTSSICAAGSAAAFAKSIFDVWNSKDEKKNFTAMFSRQWLLQQQHLSYWN